MSNFELNEATINDLDIGSSGTAFTEFMDIKCFSVILFKFLLFGKEVRNYVHDNTQFVYPAKTSRSYVSLIEACCNEKLDLNFFAISYFIEKMETFLLRPEKEESSFLGALSPTKLVNYLCQGVQELHLSAIHALSYLQYDEETICCVVKSLLYNLERNSPKKLQLACVSTLVAINSQIILSKKAIILVVQTVPNLIDSGSIVDQTVSYETGKFLAKISKELTKTPISLNFGNHWVSSKKQMDTKLELSKRVLTPTSTSKKMERSKSDYNSTSISIKPQTPKLIPSTLPVRPASSRSLLSPVKKEPFKPSKSPSPNKHKSNFY